MEFDLYKASLSSQLHVLAMLLLSLLFSLKSSFSSVRAIACSHIRTTMSCSFQGFALPKANIIINEIDCDIDASTNRHHWQMFTKFHVYEA